MAKLCDLAGAHAGVCSLLELTTPGGGVQALADAAAALLGNPLLVLGEAGEVLAVAGEPAGPRPLLDAAHELAGACAAQQPARFCIGQESGLMLRVEAHGVKLAELFLLRRRRKPQPEDERLLGYLGKLAALELWGEPRVRELGGGPLPGMLEGRQRPCQAAAAAWPAPEDMRLVAVLDAAYGGAHRSRLLAGQLCSLLPESRCTLHENKIVLLVWRSEKLLQSGPFAAYLAANGLAAGVSLPIANFFGVHSAYMQCLAALETCGRLHPEEPLRRFEACAAQHILALAAQAAELAPFLHPAVAQISAWDAAHQSELLPTLRAYLAHPGDPAAAAQELFIHKNTLFYRINRLKELFGLELAGPERLWLQLTMELAGLP